MKLLKKIAAIILFVSAFTACKKDEQEELPELPKPTVEDIEIGLNNNEIGVIGRDFHFNASILAATKIESVKIIIQPRPGETYSKSWKHEISWPEYKDAKNADIHKHFDIPDAAEGKYDFLIIVNDQNGTTLEVKRNITIYSAANLPADPKLSIFNVFTNGTPFYRSGQFVNPGTSIKKSDIINSQVSITNVKGDGKMYMLLIDKRMNHRPESMAAIDFNKVIVYDVFEHKGWTETQTFSNIIFDLATFTNIRSWPDLAVGAPSDNNAPAPNLINGQKAWASGNYYFGVIYHNSSYNMTLFNYIECNIDYK